SSVLGHLDTTGAFPSYRPVHLVWNQLNYSLFGMKPAGWHAAAILLHLCVTDLVYLLIRRLIPQRPWLAWMTSLVFGVHPVHHEVVAWISGATDSLFAVFFLLSFLTYLNWRTQGRWIDMAFSCVLYTLAMFSKETGIVLPALVFAHSLSSGETDSPS